MRSVLRLRRRVLAGTLVALVGLTGCGIGDDPVATPTVTSVRSTPTDEPDGASVPDLEEESCREIIAAAGGAREAFDEALENIAAAPEAFAQVAANIRAAARDAGGELRTVAEDLAEAVEDIAADLRRFSVPSFDGVTAALTDLDRVCGT